MKIFKGRKDLIIIYKKILWCSKKMVNLKTEYELNHIYHIRVLNTEISVGDKTCTITTLLELFQKSLALTSDLKRLPILRGITGTWLMYAGFDSSLVATGNGEFNCQVRLYNDDDTSDIEQMIWEVMAYGAGDGTNLQCIALPALSWDYEGGVLLNNEIALWFEFSLKDDAVTNAFPASYIGVSLFLEIDWYPVSKKEFQEFILENVYAIND